MLAADGGGLVFVMGGGLAFAVDGVVLAWAANGCRLAVAANGRLDFHANGGLGMAGGRRQAFCLQGVKSHGRRACSGLGPDTSQTPEDTFSPSQSCGV